MSYNLPVSYAGLLFAQEGVLSREQISCNAMAAADFAHRLRRAILHHESQIGRRVPYGELAVAIARAEGRAKPYATATVSEWVQGRSEPKLTTIEAIAAVLGVDVATLAFGAHTPSAVPDDDEATRAKARADLEALAQRAAQRERPATPKRRTKGD